MDPNLQAFGHRQSYVVAGQTYIVRKWIKIGKRLDTYPGEVLMKNASGHV